MLRTEQVDKNHLCAIARVLIGGVLLSRKSLSMDGISLRLPTLTKQDIMNLSCASRYGVTGVMLPFVRDEDDLLYLKRTLLQLNLPHIRIFAKIENRQGVEHLSSLLPHCDEIVIARGDLGNAYPLPKLPAIQKEIARTCLMAKKPFMIVTQLLASMEDHPIPTRAEVNDIFNAVLDGASSLMLTGETASGRHPVLAMEMLADTAYEALRYRMQPKRLPF
ncbi:MAG: pyruvate kinase [Eubacteriales bacterium]|nr:pyruvate kinase [Eubacteriales bacterium]